MPFEPKSRDQVPAEDKWNVKELYADVAAWEADFRSAQGLADNVEAFGGRLAESPGVLAEVLKTWFASNRRMEKIWVYAHLRSDEDLGDSQHQSMMERARSAYIGLSTAGSFMAPEILAMDDATIQEWLEHPSLEPFRVWLDDLLRGKPHTLSQPEERLLSMVSEPLSALHKVYSVLKNVDLAARLPSVVDEEGVDKKLSHGSLIPLLESRNRDVRKAAFDGYYGEYRGNRQTVAAALDGAVKANVFHARARRFDTAVEAALFPDKIDVSVYDSLIAAVHEALPAFYRYVALRKRLLGYDSLQLYDAYVPVVPSVELHYSYPQAVDLVSEAMQPLGDEYVSTMRSGLTCGWVDRYENAGKRSGAYSSGCYDSMPYILMNYSGTLDSVFTLAHELGHSMHSLHSNRAQPYHLADYRLVVAEVASTTNEALLNADLLGIYHDRATRAYLIDRYLDSFRGTLFRQTMFAEFEKEIHTYVEAGESLTVDYLDATYYGMVQLYFGDTVAFTEEDEPIAWEWARIDHFFYNYYVYKYATGMSAAIAIASRLLANEPNALTSYLAFLSGGGSKYPLDLLRDAGVDLATPEPVRAALSEFSRLVGELEELMA